MSAADQEQFTVMEATPDDGTAFLHESVLNGEDETTNHIEDTERQGVAEDGPKDAGGLGDEGRDDEDNIDENSRVEAAERKRKHISADLSDDELEKEVHNNQSPQPRQIRNLFFMTSISFRIIFGGVIVFVTTIPASTIITGL